MQKSLENMLRKQFLIISFIEQKLQIVNFIKSGFDNNRPVLIENSFLHFTAHIYYRSIIVDLYALFGSSTKMNKNSFWVIEKDFKNFFENEIFETVKDWISKFEIDIKIIKNLRDKEIAHYDFITTGSISFNFNNLYEINKLFALSKQIICYYGSSIKENSSIGFDLENTSDELYSLQELLMH